MTAFIEQATETSSWTGGDALCQSIPAEPDMQNSVDSLTSAAAIVPRHRRVALLTRVVEAEILPRLAQARKRLPATTPKRAASVPLAFVTTAEDTARLVKLLLAGNAADGMTYINDLMLLGASASSLYLGIITQAARILGELWEDDRADFAQVTISMGLLQHVVRALSPDFQSAGVTRAHADTVLLLPAPGEQHSLGLVILAEFFRREGWHVVGGPISSANDAASIVERTWIDVAGFSIGSGSKLDSLTACIRGVRQASCNKDIKIMVGGPLLLLRPDLVGVVGADSSAADAPSAVREARGLISMRAAAD